MLAAFTALFACALLAHQLWWGGFATWSPHGLLVLVALWCLVRPGSQRRMLVLAATTVGVLALDMPQLGDHELLLLVTAVALLAWTGGRRLLGRTAGADATWAALAPFLRGAVVLLYAAAALSKLNAGFLDPVTSCAAGMSRRLLGGGGEGYALAAVSGTVAVEAALAGLLLVRRTRRMGVALGLGFHAVLAGAGNVPFAVVLTAFYLAFLPAGTVDRLATVAGRVGRVRGRPAMWLAGLCAAWLAGAAAGPVPGAYGGAVGVASRSVVAAVLVLACIALVADVVRRREPPADRAMRLRPAFAAGLLLLAANAASPYLGLKTEASFAMYSNLQTAPGHFNHLLVPERLRIFHAQDDLVQVVWTPDRRLTRFTRGGTLMVRFELERYLRANPRSSAWIVPDEAPAGTPPEGPLRAETVPAGGVLDRLVNFSDVSPGGRC